MFFSGSGAKFVLYVVLWTAGLAAFVRTWRRDRRLLAFWQQGLVVLWAVLPVIITITASRHHSVFAQKYLLVCLPATILLASTGASLFRAKYIGLALVVVLCGLSIGTDIRSAYKPREDWRSATQAILSNAHPGDAVIFYPFYSRVAFEYYRQRYPAADPDVHIFSPEFYGTGDDQQKLQQALAVHAGPSRIWVVLQGPDARGGDLVKVDPAIASALEAQFGPPTVRLFKDIAVAEFEPKDTAKR
jgi:hypothetical protein